MAHSESSYFGPGHAFGFQARFLGFSFEFLIEKQIELAKIPVLKRLMAYSEGLPEQDLRYHHLIRRLGEVGDQTSPWMDIAMAETAEGGYLPD